MPDTGDSNENSAEGVLADVRTDPVSVFTRGSIEVRETEGGNEVVVTDAIIPLNDLHFHQYCAGFGREKWYAAESQSRPLKLITGPVRAVGRRWPAVVMIATALLFVIAEFYSIGGLSDLLMLELWTLVPYLAVGAIVWLLLLYLLDRGGVVEWRRLIKPALIYGLMGWLFLGAVFAAYLVYISDDPTTIDRNVVFVSGYLLAMLIGGMIAYDTVLRAENLLWFLDTTNIIHDRNAYSEFKRALRDQLSTTTFGVPISYLFAGLIMSQFFVFWYFTTGPQELDYTPGIVVNVVFNTVLAIGLFQFLVVISRFYSTVSGDYQTESGGVQLRYKPFHPDGRGGFRDLGRAAMRVNALLIIAGAAFSYRMFVQGSRAFDADIVAMSVTPELIIWTFDYIVPVVLYAVVAFIWLYFVFWQLHIRMARSKEQLILSKQYAQRNETSPTNLQHSPLVEEASPIGGPEDEPAWRELRDAPEWPIDRRQLTTLVSANTAPVVVTAVSLPF